MVRSGSTGHLDILAPRTAPFRAEAASPRKTRRITALQKNLRRTRQRHIRRLCDNFARDDVDRLAQSCTALDGAKLVWSTGRLHTALETACPFRGAQVL